MSRKQIVEDIMNNLINITLIDYVEGGSNSKDGKTIDFKHQQHQTVNAIARRCSACCLRDWANDYTILRDEVVASVFEIITKISEDYSEEELLLILSDLEKKEHGITHSFLVSTFKLGVFYTKKQLSGHRRSGGTLAKTFESVEYNEETLNRSIVEFTPEDVDKDITFFLRWFHSNKDQFLTKKQRDFINDPTVINEKNYSSMRKRIYNNTLTAFQEQFTNDDDKINELQDQIKNIERILESKDFPAQIIKHRDKSYILDPLVTYVDMPIMQRFNRGDYSYEVLKQYRVALFKALNNLNNLLNQAKNKENEEVV